MNPMVSGVQKGMGAEMGAIMQGIELDDVNHIPLAMNEFCGVGQRETKKLLENRVGQCLNRPRLIYLRPLGML
jgi:hypothetical protein